MNREKQKKILESAEKLFNRFGVRKTAVDEIAADARVSKVTIYNNFRGKDGVLQEILKGKISMFEKGVELSLRAIADPAGRLKNVLMRRLLVIQESPFLRDRFLRIEESRLRGLVDELDVIFRRFIAGILEANVAPDVTPADKAKVLDMTQYFLRGLEESLFADFDGQWDGRIEQDIEYFVRRIVPGNF